MNHRGETFRYGGGHCNFSDVSAYLFPSGFLCSGLLCSFSLKNPDSNTPTQRALSLKRAMNVLFLYVATVSSQTTMGNC